VTESFCKSSSFGTRAAGALTVLGGVTVYFAMRVWTYLVFAEARLDIARHTLSQTDVEWFRQTLAGVV
jgi:hypothetical protein